MDILTSPNYYRENQRSYEHSNNIYCGNCGKEGHTYRRCRLPITSCGVILYKKNKFFKSIEDNNGNITNNNIRYNYLLIQRRDTLGYVDFLRGKYNISSKFHIMNLLNEMTIDEKKNLTTFQQLREIKPKKYSFYRLDTLFKKNKFIDLKIVKNGGWHFTRILSPQDIHSRELETEHSDEYLKANKNSKKIKDLISRKVIDHDHLVDKKEYKFSREFKLKTLSINQLPIYIQDNVVKFSNYLDLE